MNLNPLSVEDIVSYLTLSYTHVAKTSGATVVMHDDKVTETIREIAKWLSLPTSTSKTGLLLIGNVGVGKTTAVRAVEVMLKALSAKAEREGDSSIPRERLDFTTARNLCDVNLKDVSEAEKIISSRFLAVDDMGAEDVVAKRYGTTITPIADMIYSRYEMRKPTIITTNLTLQGIRDAYGERVYDRLKEAYQVVAINAKSRR